MGLFGFLPTLKTLENIFEYGSNSEPSDQPQDQFSSQQPELTTRPSSTSAKLQQPVRSSYAQLQQAQDPRKELPSIITNGHDTFDSLGTPTTSLGGINGTTVGDGGGGGTDPLSDVIFRRATNDLSLTPTHLSAIGRSGFSPVPPDVPEDDGDQANFGRANSTGPATVLGGGGDSLLNERNTNNSGSRQITPGGLVAGSSQANSINSGAPGSVGTSNFGHAPSTSVGGSIPGLKLGPEHQQVRKTPSRPGFFFRLKKSSGRPTLEDEQDISLSSDRRDEGWKADVVGYVPDLPEQPKYIHVRAHKKQKREFNRVFLAQELKPPNLNTPLDNMAAAQNLREKRYGVWCAKFSKDGRYLAVAGEDGVVRIWQVISWPQDRNGSGSDDMDDDITRTNFGGSSASVNFNGSASTIGINTNQLGSGGSTNGNGNGNGNGQKASSSSSGKRREYAPVFKPEPVREFFGHSADVLDLSWSKNNFLLSSSMDKTVRLWHVDRSHCLASFLHSDFVTCIQFHPNDDRFFLSGSLDCQLRLWSIPDREVAYQREVPDLITAAAFSPNGTVAIVGCFGGQCFFYETDGLKYQTQMHVRSSRGRNSHGSKITGIEVFQLPTSVRYARSLSFDNVKLLISTNDSRLRVYNFFDRTLEYKFKGHVNEQSQIRATFSDNGMYIISGSEDDRTYIWSLEESAKETAKKKKERQEYEYFHSNKSMVTVALFAPTLTRRILAASDDPIYEICEPPPVRLTPHGSDMDPSMTYYSHQQLQRMTSTERVANQKFPSLRTATKRGQHNNGNIIVTAGRDGVIKIFRQDCAYESRKILSDTASIMQRKRLSGIGLSPSHSWRDSFSIHRSRSAKAPSIRAGSPNPGSMRFNDDTGSFATYNSISPSAERGRSRAASSAGMNGSSSRDPSSFVASSPESPKSIATATAPGLRKISSKLRIQTSVSDDDSHDDNTITSTNDYNNGNAHENIAADEAGTVIQCTSCGGTSFMAKKLNNNMQLVCSRCMAPRL